MSFSKLLKKENKKKIFSKLLKKKLKNFVFPKITENETNIVFQN